VNDGGRIAAAPPCEGCARHIEESKVLIITLTNGLTIAAMLFIMAIGLNLSFGLLRVVNMSHGALYLLGGYVGLAAIRQTGSWGLGLLAGGLATAVVAFVEERALLKRCRGNSTMETLVSLSAAIIIADLLVVFWGGNPKQLRIPGLLAGYVAFPGFNLPKYNIFLVGFACVVGAALWVVLRKTKIGMIIRAGVDNFEITSTLGIDVQLVFTLVFVLAGFLAGIAGVIGGTYLMVAPGEDSRILIFTLLIVIIGGMGSFGGCVVGSIIIGLINSFGTAYAPQFSLFVMFAPVAIVLAFRPRGLFGRI
jgi:branched-chain amino acid transport system permease protein